MYVLAAIRISVRTCDTVVNPSMATVGLVFPASLLSQTLTNPSAEDVAIEFGSSSHQSTQVIVREWAPFRVCASSREDVPTVRNSTRSGDRATQVGT